METVTKVNFPEANGPMVIAGFTFVRSEGCPLLGATDVYVGDYPEAEASEFVVYFDGGFWVVTPVGETLSLGEATGNLALDETGLRR